MFNYRAERVFVSHLKANRGDNGKKCVPNRNCSFRVRERERERGMGEKKLLKHPLVDTRRDIGTTKI